MRLVRLPELREYTRAYELTGRYGVVLFVNNMLTAVKANDGIVLEEDLNNPNAIYYLESEPAQWLALRWARVRNFGINSTTCAVSVERLETLARKVL